MTPADRSLATIRDLYRQLERLPHPERPHSSGGPGGLAYRALVRQIRAAVDQRRQIVGEELVLVATMHVCGQRGQRGRVAEVAVPPKKFQWCDLSRRAA